MTQPLPDDEEVPGLAGERSDLAWSRSGLAALVGVGALVKSLLDVDTDRATVLVVVFIVAGAIAWVLALLHARFVAQTTLAGRVHADAGKLRAVALGTTALGLGALVLALFG